jgi:acetyl-CoA decarbonylase/synthase complex subunit gamma
MDYSIDPGLYALGRPDSKSPVLVSANYKMSFDNLRQSLGGRNAWILVLDTDGINVWCSAGDGTFGTEELVRRIKITDLEKIVAHREIIVPQLAGPGVSAFKVRELSGFNVHFGPIRATDIPAYIDAGLKATREMRRKTFTLVERLVLIPVELVHTLKPSLFIIPVLFLLGGLGGPGGFWANSLNHGLFAALAFLSAVVGGTVLSPIFLPYLPGRAFSAKGFFVGLGIAALVLSLKGFSFNSGADLMEASSWFLIITALSSYMALNFTGCSTFTSLSGVKKELRWSLPILIGMASVGLIGWITSRLIA